MPGTAVYAVAVPNEPRILLDLTPTSSTHSLLSIRSRCHLQSGPQKTRAERCREIFIRGLFNSLIFVVALDNFMDEGRGKSEKMVNLFSILSCITPMSKCINFFKCNFCFRKPLRHDLQCPTVILHCRFVITMRLKNRSPYNFQHPT